MGQNLLQGLNELIYRSICCNAFEEYQIYRYIYGVHEVTLSVYDLWLKLCCSLYRLYFYVMVKGNILMIFVFYSCKLSVAKDLKTFERYLTTDLKHPRSIPHRVLSKTLKEILKAIDVMLFVGILLGLFSHRIPYGVIAFNAAKGIEENLERGAFTSIDPAVIICENTFRVIKPQNPLRELLPTIPERVL